MFKQRSAVLTTIVVVIALLGVRHARADMADMSTCIIVGSVETRLIERENQAPLVYSPRSWPAGKA